MRVSAYQSDRMSSTSKHRTVKAADSACANNGDFFEWGIQRRSLGWGMQTILISCTNG
jgi:hypothetical protein